MSRTARPNMKPRMTDDRKPICDQDDKTFNTREEYDKHLSVAHMRSSGSKGL